LSRLSRRKFLYASVGVAATAGIGYLTKDYWYSRMHEAYREFYTRISPETKPSSLPTSTPTQTPTESPTPITPSTPTPTPTEPMSEDEVAIRKLLDEWMDMYNKENANKVYSIYTDDALVDFGCRSRTSSRQHRGYNTITGFLTYWAFDNHARITSLAIKDLRIDGNEAYLSGKYTLIFQATSVRTTIKMTFVKITKIKRGNAEFELPKPRWRISYEYNHCTMDD